MKKKAAVLGLALALVVLLYSVQASQTLRIEDRAWNMTLLLNGEGNVLACGPDLAEIYPDTEVLALSCQAKDGQLRLARTDSSETNTGVYRQTDRTQAGRLYEVEVKDLGWGYGSCSFTNPKTGETAPTLVLTFPRDYTLYFTGTKP